MAPPQITVRTSSLPANARRRSHPGPLRRDVALPHLPAPTLPTRSRARDPRKVASAGAAAVFEQQESTLKFQTGQVEALRARWLDEYRKGITDLSMVNRPVFMPDGGFLRAPTPVDEIERLVAVTQWVDAGIWENKKWFDVRLRPLLEKYNVQYATVSTIEADAQVVHYKIGLSSTFSVISRDVSLDAHAILSLDHFGLLNANSDWRFRLNPLVHGAPNIAFYLAVPVFIRFGYTVGTVAIGDSTPRDKLPVALVQALKSVARELSTRLDQRAPVAHTALREDSRSPTASYGDYRRIGSDQFSVEEQHQYYHMSGTNIELLGPGRMWEHHRITDYLARGITSRGILEAALKLVKGVLAVKAVQIVRVALETCFAVPSVQLSFEDGALFEDLDKRIDASIEYANLVKVCSVMSTSPMEGDLVSLALCVASRSGISYDGPLAGAMMPFLRTSTVLEHEPGVQWKHQQKLVLGSKWAFSGALLQEPAKLEQSHQQLFAMVRARHSTEHSTRHGTRNARPAHPHDLKMYAKSQAHVLVCGGRVLHEIDFFFMRQVVQCLEALLANNG